MALDLQAADVIGRGRPSNRQLSERLERSRQRVEDLELDDQVKRAEDRAVAGELLALSRRLELAVRAGRPDVVHHSAGRLAFMAAAIARRSAR